MNKDRRTIAQICIALMKECAEIGEISDDAHTALTEALGVLQGGEHWQLKNQLKHEGKNPGTDTQIAISRVALPAIEAAVDALSAGDYSEVITQLELAVTTDGTTPRKRRKTK